MFLFALLLAPDCYTPLIDIGNGQRHAQVEKAGPVVDVANPNLIHYPDGSTVEYKNSDPMNPHGEKANGTVYINSKNPSENISFIRTDRGQEDILREELYPKELVSLWHMRGKKVLDIGTGLGKWVKEMSGAGIDAYGLDIFLSPSQRKDFRFIMGDVSKTGLESNQFDVIFSNVSSFHWKTETQRAALVTQLNEIKRILKTGGVVRISPVKKELIESLVQEVGGFTFNQIPPPGWKGLYFVELKKTD